MQHSDAPPDALYCVYCRGYYSPPHRCSGEGSGSSRCDYHHASRSGFDASVRARTRHENRAIELLRLIRESLDEHSFTVDDVRAEEDARMAARQGESCDGRGPRPRRRYGPSHLARLVSAGLVEDLGDGTYAVAHAPGAERMEVLRELEL